MSRAKTEVYFFLKEGKVTGPIYIEDVKGMIQAGELTPMDLLYAESEKVWKPVGEFGELSGAGASSDSESSSRDTSSAGSVEDGVQGEPNPSAADADLGSGTDTDVEIAPLNPSEDIDEQSEITATDADYEEGSFVGLGVSDHSFADFQDPFLQPSSVEAEKASDTAKDEAVSEDDPLDDDANEISAKENERRSGGAWVVLRKKPGFEDQYEQLGPMDERTVYDMIAAGKLGFQDFVWTDGYSDWKLITEDDNFKGRVAFWGKKKPKLPKIPSGPEDGP
ncbi:MAG: GYF domain-containing protein, partial [Pseudomonadota bacterium]